MLRDDRAVARTPLHTTTTTRKLRILFVVILVIMTIQGWFGDTVNIFYAPVTSIQRPSFTMGGFFQAVQGVGFPLIYHTFEGVLLVALGIASAALAFTWSGNRSVKICTVLGAVAIFSAALGGFLFVMSGFSNGGNSAQMGGSFIGAYAFYFMALYYAK
jgi:hypothetical protein